MTRAERQSHLPAPSIRLTSRLVGFVVMMWMLPVLALSATLAAPPDIGNATSQRVADASPALARQHSASEAAATANRQNEVKDGVDLVGVLQQAELHDPAYAAARLQVIAETEGKGRARSAFFPRIEGGWAKARINIKTEDFPSASYTQSGWQISLTQPLFDWEIWATYKQAALQQVKAEMQLALAHQALLLRGVSAYFELLMACDDIALARAHLAALDAQSKIAKKRFKAGESTLIDLRDIDVDISRAQADLNMALASADVKRNALEEVYGNTIRQVFSLAEQVSIPGVYPDSAVEWEAQAKQSNLDIQLQEMERRSASLETSKARAGYLPKVGLSASHSPMSAASGVSAPSTTNSIMLQVQIPLFSGFETRHQVRQNLALEEKAAYELDAAERKARKEVRESFMLAQAGQARIAQLKAVVAASTSAVDATQIGYRIGNRSDVDLLRVQSALRSAQKDLLRTRYEVLLYGIRLKALTASLRIEDIAWLNSLLTQKRLVDERGR